nr:MAG TPA: hypothetical protein [Caudoviricetes sp.]
MRRFCAVYFLTLSFGFSRKNTLFNAQFYDNFTTTQVYCFLLVGKMGALVFSLKQLGVIK